MTRHPYTDQQLSDRIEAIMSVAQTMDYATARGIAERDLYLTWRAGRQWDHTELVVREGGAVDIQFWAFPKAHQQGQVQVVTVTLDEAAELAEQLARLSQRRLPAAPEDPALPPVTPQADPLAKRRPAPKDAE